MNPAEINDAIAAELGLRQSSVSALAIENAQSAGVPDLDIVAFCIGFFSVDPSWQRGYDPHGNCGRALAHWVEVEGAQGPAKMAGAAAYDRHYGGATPVDPARRSAKVASVRRDIDAARTFAAEKLRLKQQNEAASGNVTPDPNPPTFTAIGEPYLDAVAELALVTDYKNAVVAAFQRSQQ